MHQHRTATNSEKEKKNWWKKNSCAMEKPCLSLNWRKSHYPFFIICSINERAFATSCDFIHVFLLLLQCHCVRFKTVDWQNSIKKKERMIFLRIASLLIFIFVGWCFFFLSSSVHRKILLYNKNRVHHTTHWQRKRVSERQWMLLRSMNFQHNLIYFENGI